jgi:class 3 adenylate cyclase
MTAQQSFQFVNQFLEYIAPEIDNNQGFIDKFLGDAVMALFVHRVDHSLKAAIGMIDVLKQLNENLDEPVKIGIGLHYGSVMLGTVGYSARLNATVISDTVNTASRLEALTKGFGANILVSQSLKEEYESLTDPVTTTICFREIGRFLLKGKVGVTVLYEVYDQSWQEKFPSSRTQGFQHCLELFQGKQLLKALSELKSLLKKFPEDKLIMFYIETCEMYIDLILPQDWQGDIKLDKDGVPQPLTSERRTSILEIVGVDQDIGKIVKEEVEAVKAQTQKMLLDVKENHQRKISEKDAEIAQLRKQLQQQKKTTSCFSFMNVSKAPKTQQKIKSNRVVPYLVNN